MDTIYELFQRMKRALIILQGIKQAEQNRQTRLKDPSSTVTLPQLAAKLSALHGARSLASL